MAKKKAKKKTKALARVEKKILTNKNGCTPQEVDFVRHFLTNGFKISEAYKSAGYESKTKQSLYSSASRLLSSDKIQYEIVSQQELMEELAEKEFNITRKDIMRELALIGFATLKDVAIWGGTEIELKDSEDLNRDQAAVLESVRISYSSGEHGVSRSVGFRANSKIKALETLAKMMGDIDGAKRRSDDESEGTNRRAEQAREERLSQAMAKLGGRK